MKGRQGKGQCELALMSRMLMEYALLLQQLVCERDANHGPLMVKVSITICEQIALYPPRVRVCDKSKFGHTVVVKPHRKNGATIGVY